MTYPEALKKLAVRSQDLARELNLAQVFPHLLFLSLYEIEKSITEQVLRAAGIDPAAYCRKVVGEIASLPKLTSQGQMGWHQASVEMLTAAADENEPVEALLKRLLKADGINVPSEQHNEGDPFKELEDLVGLGRVKDEVRKLVELVKFNAARQAKGLPTGGMTSHFVFTGNPGTGKTTVARIIAGIYRKLGILKKGHLVEVDRSRLVAGYIGQTAIQTNAVFDTAMDGALFIDEAYSLVAGGSSDYGAEAIATLLKRMEDARERIIVIVAGYSDEMQRFVRSNPGLESRFTKFIEFPDYTVDELVTIFDSIATANRFQCSSEAHEKVRNAIRGAAVDGHISGNARYVRNLFGEVRERMARRVMKIKDASKGQLQRIEAEDIP